MLTILKCYCERSSLGRLASLADSAKRRPITAPSCPNPEAEHPASSTCQPTRSLGSFPMMCAHHPPTKQPHRDRPSAPASARPGRSSPPACAQRTPPSRRRSSAASARSPLPAGRGGGKEFVYYELKPTCRFFARERRVHGGCGVVNAVAMTPGK